MENVSKKLTKPPISLIVGGYTPSDYIVQVFPPVKRKSWRHFLKIYYTKLLRLTNRYMQTDLEVFSMPTVGEAT